MIAAPPRFVSAGDRFDLHADFATDDAAARDGATKTGKAHAAEALQRLVGSSADHCRERPAWQRLPRLIARLRSALDAPAADLAACLPDLYDDAGLLADMATLDAMLRRGGELCDQPLPPEARRDLDSVILALSPWLRRFPSVRTWDHVIDAATWSNGRGIAPGKRRVDARAVVRKAMATGLLDHSAAASILDAPGTMKMRDDTEALENLTGYRDLVAGAALLRDLALHASTATADSSMPAPLPSVAQFVAAAQQDILRLAKALRDDLRLAVTIAADRLRPPRDEAQPHGARRATPPVGAHRRQGGVPDDLDLAEARRLVIAGIAPPDHWAPFIHELNLDGSALQDLAPLARLTALRGLSIARTPIHDLSPLRDLTWLMNLTLDDTGVCDLEPLAHLPALYSLSLVRCRVSTVAPLADAIGMLRLDLTGTGITDVTPLGDLVGLRHLRLTRTPIEDVNPLGALTRLFSLALDETRVSDISPLAGLRLLQTLILDGSPVSDLRPLMRLTHLRKLSIARTNVRDMSPLGHLGRLGRIIVSESLGKDDPSSP